MFIFFFLGVTFLLAQHFTLPPGLLRGDTSRVVCGVELYAEVLWGGDYTLVL